MGCGDMPELSPDLAALIRAARMAFRSRGSDRDRVLQRLMYTLGVERRPERGAMQWPN
jgi:hypothetical protein